MLGREGDGKVVYYQAAHERDERKKEREQVLFVSGIDSIAFDELAKHARIIAPFMDAALHLILVYRYWILFPLACFEGPITGFIIGTLVALGYFNVFAAYFLLVMGDIIPDTAYYLLGRYGEKGTFVKKAL